MPIRQNQRQIDDLIVQIRRLKHLIDIAKEQNDQVGAKRLEKTMNKLQAKLSKLQ